MRGSLLDDLAARVPDAEALFAPAVEEGGKLGSIGGELDAGGVMEGEGVVRSGEHLLALLLNDALPWGEG